MIEPKVQKHLQQHYAYRDDDPKKNFYVGYLDAEPGDYVSTFLPFHGWDRVFWTESGKFVVLWDNDTKQISWGIDEQWKPEVNEINGVIKVVCQQAGRYYNIFTPAVDRSIIGSFHKCSTGGSRTAMPGQHIVLINGEFLVDGEVVDLPNSFYSGLESITASSLSTGYCPRIEVIKTEDLTVRYDDEV